MKDSVITQLSDKRLSPCRLSAHKHNRLQPRQKGEKLGKVLDAHPELSRE